MEDKIRAIIKGIGEDPDREGLVKTPHRVAKALDFLTSGYRASIDEIFNKAIFHEEQSDEMVVVRDIELYSMCEHHMLPFFGKAHVAYIPNKRILGLSKLARVVDVFARRLQVQERLTHQVAQAIERHLQPAGVGVIIECYHLCMMMRGVQKQNSRTITSSLIGVMRDDPRSRAEFMKLVHGSTSRN